MDRNIRMVQGDTLAFGLEFVDLDQDLSSAYFTCRTNYGGEQLFQKSLGNGIEKVETNKYRVRVAPEDTANIAAGRYVYDLQIGANGDVFTIIRGILDIEPDVTEV